MSKPFVKVIALGMTGASGAPYGIRLLQQLVAANCQVYFMISKAARMVVAVETDYELPAKDRALAEYLSELCQARPGQIQVFGKEQWTAPVASGSAPLDALLICPASTGVLSAIATGASNNLIERAADVALKERRPLVLVPREAPLSAVHLENMLTITRMGGVIVPASPGFYHHPKSVEDMVDFVVARVLNVLGIEQDLLPAWGYNDTDTREE